ncbi:hypothetical protein LIER_22516 [Lithospermum erythrorhizon]|uniref:Uncharacterized protein n=1 Tax=Lithospermum erythrorhizon TaxID=34254 RepID=A0AAV3QXL5_LITER
MEAFHAVHPLLSADEGRKHPSSDSMDAFALFSLYMIKALNAQYALTCHEAMREISSEKMQVGGPIVAEFKDSEDSVLFVGKESAAVVVDFVTKFLGDFPQLLDIFNKFKEDWPVEYFEGLSMDAPLAEAPTKTTEAAENAEGEVTAGKIAEKGVGAVDDEAIA